MSADPFGGCRFCEEQLQPYVDRQLTEQQVREVEQHLALCPPCAKYYRLEVRTRKLIHDHAAEPMPVELKAKLAALRTPLL